MDVNILMLLCRCGPLPRRMEAAGAGLEHPDKRFGLTVNAADYNNAVKLGKARPAAGTPPLQSGFQALSEWCRAARVLDQLRRAQGHES